MPKDAIVLLKEDHKTVNQMFRKFEKAKSGDPDQLKGLVDQICLELLVHAQLEEIVFYPMARESTGDGETVSEAYEEHHVVELLIKELQSMQPTDERYTAKATVLMELVKHHVEEEENEMFPKVRDQLGRKRLTEIGAEMARTKQELQRQLGGASGNGRPASGGRNAAKKPSGGGTSKSAKKSSGKSSAKRSGERR